MKRIKNLLLATFALTTLNVAAQTADEIIAKNIEAMGGAAKIATLKTVKKTGNLSMQGTDIPMIFTVSQMKGFRVDVEVMGTSNYQIVTPEKAFMFFPIQQMTEPKQMDAEATKGMQSALDIQGAFTNYKEKGSTVELVGNEKVDGADAYKLKLTGKSGKSAFYFVDVKTNRLVKTSGKTAGPDGVELDVETTYSDYKQNADGYWFAFATTTPQGPIVFDKIETNIPVDENIFKN
jgi:hypothetical protein